MSLTVGTGGTFICGDDVVLNEYITLYDAASATINLQTTIDGTLVVENDSTIEIGGGLTIRNNVFVGKGITVTISDDTNADIEFSNNGYTFYSGLASQSSTSDPTEGTHTNRTGAALVFERSSTGVYTITADTAIFDAAKTVVLPPAFLNSLYGFTYRITSATVITINTSVLTLGAYVLTDGILSNTLVEIRNYF